MWRNTPKIKKTIKSKICGGCWSLFCYFGSSYISPHGIVLPISILLFMILSTQQLFIEVREPSKENGPSCFICVRGIEEAGSTYPSRTPGINPVFGRVRVANYF